MNERLYEDAKLDDATHVQINGRIYRLGLDNFVVEREGYMRGLRWLEEDAFIPLEMFHILGMKLLKEIKREPIVFEATFAKLWHGNWLPIYDNIIGVTYQNNKKTRFRCVEILEDEE